MDKAQFWQIIAESRAQSGGKCKAQAQALLRLLKRLSGDEIVAFKALFNVFREQAYRWDLWGAAVIINGGASDDGFEYFRRWLIGQGEQIYEATLRDPDTLADIVDPARDDCECEDLLYCISAAYEAVTGREMPSFAIRDYAPEPAGTRWQEDELDAMFPRLCALYDGAAEVNL